MEIFKSAKWIGEGLKLEGTPTGYLSPALQLRKEFSLSCIKNTICKICGLGIFKLYINGKKVGDEVLAPDFTDYNKRIFFYEYDVSQYLKKGKNIVAVKLGDGFYNQTTKDTWGFYTASWRDYVKLALEICVGDDVVLATDESWRVTSNGATYHSAIRTGEYYDARKQDGWKGIDYDDSLWKYAVLVDEPKGVLVQSTQPPVRECEILSPVSIKNTTDGCLVDFGKNICGYISIAMYGKCGEELSICYCEKLKNGKPDNKENAVFIEGTDNFAVDKYIFSGKGIECWKPEFVYHGFRYVYLTGMRREIREEEIAAYFIHTDLKRIGNFKSSDEQMNWIYQAGIQSFLSNYVGFPTDCPHREKNGWTGDAVNSAAYAVFNFDMRSAYQKWIEDIVDSQKENGQIPGIVPTCGWGYDWGSGPAWDSALFILPYELYLETGYSDVLEIAFPAMKKYLLYAKSKRLSGLVKYGLNDWCFPESISDIKIMDNCFSDSCYYYKMQEIASFTAKLLGKDDLSREYYQDAMLTKEAIIKTFICGDRVDNDSQGALACALYYGLIEGEQAQEILQKLIRVVEQDNYTFRVGILGIKALLNALCEYGRVDVAYKMLAQTDFPSYGFWRLQGATTLWENWDGVKSHNHHMFGDVLNVMTRYIAGLQNSGIRYNECLVKPYFFAENCSAMAETYIDDKRIFVSWVKEKEELVLHYEIPVGVRATLKIENMPLIKLEQGTHFLNIFLKE